MKSIITFSKLALVFLAFCINLNGYAQAPQGFSYQGVVRNSSGAPIGNQAIGIKVTLESASHIEYYSETQTKETNSQGVFTITIGLGERTSSGLFKDIPWSNGDIQLKIGIDVSGGTSYTTLDPPTILQAVPYALYAENAKEIVSLPDAQDIDPIFVVKNKAGQAVFAVYQTGVRVFVEDSPVIKGARGGFAVGGLSQTKAGTNPEFFRITSDSTRVYLKTPVTKGARGGFAVGGLSQTKGTSDDYFNVSPNSSPSTVTSSAQMLWYPLKEAFLVGRVEILDPNDVGLNSFASGSLSKAKGDYSQAMGTNSIASGDYSTAIGQSCISSGQYSFAFGSNAQATNTNNIAIGNFAISSGYSNCYALGNAAQVTTSTDCYSFGTQASVSNGLNSYAIGSQSKVLPMGATNTAWGSYAIGDHAETVGQRAYAIGSHARALFNDAIAIGTNAKATAYTSIAIGANGSGSDTTFATGDGSIAFGYAARADGASSISLGTWSIASGLNSCAFGDGAQATGAYSAAFGRGAKSTYSNSTAFGNGAITDGDNTIRLGNGSVEFIKGNVGISISSDKRLKKNIKDINSGLDFILKLRPVEYQMIKGDDRINYGFIAQDIEQLLGTNNSILTIDGDKDRTLGLRYTDFIAPLVKALQEQQKQIEVLKERNKEVDALKAELETIKAMLKK